MHTIAEEQLNPRQRVLDAAEDLFMQRGYNAIALRDIADALGIKQASLYYHFPGGKEELYVAVAERVFANHYAGVQDALKGETLEEQLHAVAHWFSGQRQMSLLGMIHADLPALQPAHTGVVQTAALRGIFLPLSQAFAAAMTRGEIEKQNPHMLAGAFLSLLDGLAIAQMMGNAPDREQVAGHLIDIMLNGIRPRKHAWE